MLIDIFGGSRYWRLLNVVYRRPMEKRFKMESVFNGYGKSTRHEVQEIEGEKFIGSPEAVFPGDILEKCRSLCR